jgi:fructokinase
MNVRLPIAVFGESLVDVLRSGSEFTARAGGSPLNVAVGLARLGAEVEFATSVGRDDHGVAVIEHLAAAGVQVTGGSVGAGPTSVAEASIGADGSASYRFELAWDPDVAPERPAVAGHFGSISAVLEPGAQRVLEWAANLSDEVVVSFDPNIRPSITGTGDDLRAAVSRAVAVADIVKLSSEDLDLLGDPDLPARWIDGGASLVVVTLGERGAWLATAAGEAERPAPIVSVVDTIGAGDSFMAGLLWSLGHGGLLDRNSLRGASIDTLARHAAFAMDCAAVTVGREGADPPWPGELSRMPRVDGAA